MTLMKFCSLHKSSSGIVLLHQFISSNSDNFFFLFFLSYNKSMPLVESNFTPIHQVIPYTDCIRCFVYPCSCRGVHTAVIIPRHSTMNRIFLIGCLLSSPVYMVQCKIKLNEGEKQSL